MTNNPNKLRNGFERTQICLEIDINYEKIHKLTYKNLFEIVQDKMNELDFGENVWMYLVDATCGKTEDEDENFDDDTDMEKYNLLCDCEKVKECSTDCIEECKLSKLCEIANDKNQTKLKV